MKEHLFQMTSIIPPITDKQIEEMRHIEYLHTYNGREYQRIKGFHKINPKNQAFNWDVIPYGEKFGLVVL